MKKMEYQRRDKAQRELSKACPTSEFIPVIK